MGGGLCGTLVCSTSPIYGIKWTLDEERVSMCHFLQHTSKLVPHIPSVSLRHSCELLVSTKLLSLFSYGYGMTQCLYHVNTI